MTSSGVQRIVILGGGGDAIVVAETLRQAAEAGQPVALAGFLDDSLAGQRVGDAPVLGRLDDWEALDADISFIPAIQKVRDAPRRAARVDRLGIPRDRWARIIHPRAVVAQNAVIGAGVYI